MKLEEIAARSDCIPSTILGKICGTEEKSANREGSSISNKTDGWYSDDEEQVEVEWRAC